MEASLIYVDGRMDGRTDISKLIGGFPGFAKSPVSHTFFLLLPSFHVLSANMFKLIPNFLSPVTLSGNFTLSLAAYKLDVYACVS